MLKTAAKKKTRSFFLLNFLIFHSLDGWDLKDHKTSLGNNIVYNTIYLFLNNALSPSGV